MTQSILQTSLFEPPQVDIPGLAYLPNYIDEQAEADLLRHIDDQPWITELKRRVQHYATVTITKQEALLTHSG